VVPTLTAKLVEPLPHASAIKDLKVILPPDAPSLIYAPTSNAVPTKAVLAEVVLVTWDLKRRVLDVSLKILARPSDVPVSQNLLSRKVMPSANATPVTKRKSVPQHVPRSTLVRM